MMNAIIIMLLSSNQHEREGQIINGIHVHAFSKQQLILAYTYPSLLLIVIVTLHLDLLVSVQN